MPSLLLLVMLFLALPVRAQMPYPDPRGRVSDFAQALDASTKEQLNTLLAQVEQQTTAEIAVVTVDTTAPLTPKQYVTELMNRWGVGKQGADSGVMILLAIKDRRVEIETGYGVEGILPDGKVGEIIRTAMVPYLRRDAWGEGLLAGTRQIAQVLRQEYQAPTTPAEPAEPFSTTGLIVTLAGFMALTFVLLRMVRRRRTRCPQCGRQLERRTGILRVPTSTRPGLRELIYDCPNCSYHDVQVATIPQRLHWSRQRPRRSRWPAGGVLVGGGWPGGICASRGRSGGGVSFPGFGGGASGGGGAGASF